MTLQLHQRHSPRYPYIKAKRLHGKQLPHTVPYYGRLHNRIVMYRMARDMTQEALAELAGVSRRTINSVETSTSQPRIGVAMALDAPVEAIFHIK